MYLASDKIKINLLFNREMCWFCFVLFFFLLALAITQLLGLFGNRLRSAISRIKCIELCPPNLLMIVLLMINNVFCENKYLKKVHPFSSKPLTSFVIGLWVSSQGIASSGKSSQLTEIRDNTETVNTCCVPMSSYLIEVQSVI